MTDHILPRPGIVADRLRAAAEFRRNGQWLDALIRVTYARNIRLAGAEAVEATFPDPYRVNQLARWFWQRENPAR